MYGIYQHKVKHKYKLVCEGYSSIIMHAAIIYPKILNLNFRNFINYGLSYANSYIDRLEYAYEHFNSNKLKEMKTLC